MSPAPIVAAAGTAVVTKGPSWSSEIRKWAWIGFVGLVLVGAILVVIIWAGSIGLKWYDGQCEADGYSTLWGCALGGATSAIAGAATGAATGLFTLLFPVPAYGARALGWIDS